MQDVLNPLSPPYFYCMQDVPFTLDFSLYTMLLLKLRSINYCTFINSTKTYINVLLDDGPEGKRLVRIWIKRGIYIYYTGCFTTLGHNCRR